jgi:uncharacterized protein
VLRLLEQRGWEALDRFVLEHRVRLASELVVTECRRAVLRADGSPELRAFVDRALDRLDLIPVSGPILHRAGTLMPPALRTLDAIHLATALEIGPVDAFVTYDGRLAEAARHHGLRVVAPS